MTSSLPIPEESTENINDGSGTSAVVDETNPSVLFPSPRALQTPISSGNTHVTSSLLIPEESTENINEGPGTSAVVDETNPSVGILK
jgi:hypothetical protein